MLEYNFFNKIKLFSDATKYQKYWDKMKYDERIKFIQSTNFYEFINRTKLNKLLKE